jgi:ABC-type transport system involved in multi-copper enzyme maturation permease subunit
VILGQLSAGQDVKIIKDLGLAVIELAGVLMSVFVGVGLVSREIDRRSIHGLLTKPLPRWEFIVGKYAGLMLTIGVNVVAMTAALYVALALLWAASPVEVRQSWDAPAVDPGLALQIVLTLAELALLTAIAVLFSTFSSSALLSVSFTIGLFIAGLASRDLRGFGDIVDAPAGVTWLVTVIGWIVPAFSIFSEGKGDIVHGIRPAAGAVVSALAYAATYSAAAVLAATAIFSRREFK